MGGYMNGSKTNGTENGEDASAAIAAAAATLPKSKLERWADFTETLKIPLVKLIRWIALKAARNPCATVCALTILSFSCIIAGFLTSFKFETDNRVLWSPLGSVTLEHGEYIMNNYAVPRTIFAIVHNNGRNVLSRTAIDKTFQVVETVRNTEGYMGLCKMANKCVVDGVTGFWEGHDRDKFLNDTSTDDDVVQKVSHFQFADGEYVNRLLTIGDSKPAVTVEDLQTFLLRERLMGGNIYKNMTDAEIQAAITQKAAEEFRLQSAESYLLRLTLEGVTDEEALPIEKKAMQNILGLNEIWALEDPVDKFEVSVVGLGAYGDELSRTVSADLPLMVSAFLFMTLFCTTTLCKCNTVNSSSVLGIGAVASIILSLMTGYGLLFLSGIPLTSLTYLFPYAMLGFGLDDIFILTGSFERTDNTKHVEDRILDVIDDVGTSISVSTITTVVAYLLGSTSKMPGVRWFCYYAAPLIVIAYLYQLTFFVGLLVLNERRIKANRFDCLCCFKSKKTYTTDDDVISGAKKIPRSISSKVMASYGNFLLRPIVKAVVIILFMALLVAGAVYGSGIQSFLDFNDLLPTVSFVRDYFHDLDEYGGGTEVVANIAGIYFRDVDVSDDDVQEAMMDFVDDVVGMPYLSSHPLTFWLRDFQYFINRNDTLKEFDFPKQLDIFLGTPPFDTLYENDIVRDDDGYVITSRAFIIYDLVDPYDILQQTEALKAQKEISRSQPINEGLSSVDQLFFSMGDPYYLWELWGAVPRELLMTFALGIASVTIICLIFVSHPMAVCILTPTIVAIFIEVVAAMRLAGLTINALSAISLITCLGLVMDYAIHICITYFEIKDARTRDERVLRVINTMGVSIMKGGFTTLLGVLPLSLNSSLGFKTIFITFLAISTLGVSHGLIFIPVVLSYIGPMNDCQRSSSSSTDSHNTEAVTDNGAEPVVVVEGVKRHLFSRNNTQYSRHENRDVVSTAAVMQDDENSEIASNDKVEFQIFGVSDVKNKEPPSYPLSEVISFTTASSTESSNLDKLPR